MRNVKVNVYTFAAALLVLTSCSNAVQTTDNKIVVETIMSRRSVRSYKAEPISRENMDIIVECGINAPSAKNEQPWEVRVVDNQEFLTEISNLQLAELDSTRRQQMTAQPGYRNIFRNAPTVVFIACRADGGGQLDCGLLGENMIIAAQSMGIGSCCLGAPVRFMKSETAAPFLTKLNFSSDYQLLYAIGFGYPDEQPEAKPRIKEKAQYVD